MYILLIHESVGRYGRICRHNIRCIALIYEAKRHGARAALFGRKINAAEHQLSLVEYLRLVADDQILPAEAAKAYHAALQKRGIAPIASCEPTLN